MERIYYTAKDHTLFESTTRGHSKHMGDRNNFLTWRQHPTVNIRDEK
uniref:Uncharacterized protein n=1 Tax=Anguilla anguilla TaxID=7936 RepID=A0A0E9VSE2_ANGAN